MTVNLHLGLTFCWTLDAGAPPELVTSMLPAQGSGVTGTLGYTSLASSANSILSSGGRQSLLAVNAVGGAALSGVTRGLSLVNGKFASAERAKALREEVYRTVRMRAETAGLAGRRMGSLDHSSADAIFMRLCKEDRAMREIYGAKCPFENLDAVAAAAAARGGGTGARAGGEVSVSISKSGGSGRFVVDCLKEELTRRREFIEAQRVLIEQLTRVSALLAGVPKDARTSQMRRMLREINASLPTGSYFPLCHSAARHQVVVAVAYEEAVCLSTFERAPYAVALEMVELPHTLQHTYAVVRSVELNSLKGEKVLYMVVTLCSAYTRALVFMTLCSTYTRALVARLSTLTLMFLFFRYGAWSFYTFGSACNCRRRHSIGRAPMTPPPPPPPPPSKTPPMRKTAAAEAPRKGRGGWGGLGGGERSGRGWRR
jgi:hypothetical protein